MTNFDDLTLLNDVLRAIYSADTADFPQVLDDLTAASAGGCRAPRRPGSR
ncbi:antar domain protein [Mycobacterium avium subsp. avium 2285 (R)]|nr:antar domain protein [Mycobacterium avium subsp. avium 2285 (R)]